MRLVLKRRILYIFVSLLIVGKSLAEAPVSKLTTTQLENRLVEIDMQLGELADYSLRSGYGTIGWRSEAHQDADHTEWIQIDLGADIPIDQVVLAPAILRGAKSGYQAEGFPLEFRVIAGREGDSDGTVIGGGTAKDQLLPRYAPVIIPCPKTTASWIRVEATTLSPRSWDGKHLLQLSEIMVFSGQRNVALHQSVQTSSMVTSRDPSLTKEFLVDGFMPYLMDAAQGEQSVAFLAGTKLDHSPQFIIDLGSPQPINRMHLHAMDVSDSVPQVLPTDLGIPGRLVVEGANQSDFSDATIMLEYRKDSVYDTGPIIALKFPEAICRYVKLTAYEPFILYRKQKYKPHERGARIGFAEIELFTDDRNVAINCPITANVKETSDRKLSALTDGHNQFGNILPIRTWLEQLARRHEFEAERPRIADELNRRYLRQKTNLTRMIWLAALLAGGIVITILVERIKRLRQAANIRERLAADLHDELGANIYTIGLLGDVALDAMKSPERLQDVLQRNKEVIKRTGTAVRHCINMQEAQGSFGNLLTDMERIAQRILTDLEYEISVVGEEFLETLKPNTRDDLRLFFKECLVNISRHAEASAVVVELKVNKKELTLSVSDNGHGILGSDTNDIPLSIKRRARFLRATVSIAQSESGGTCISLALKLPWLLRTKKPTKS